MITIFAVVFAVCLISALVGVLVLAVRGEERSAEAIRNEKHRRIALAERAARLARAPRAV